jgi:hypothetical protein
VSLPPAKRSQRTPDQRGGVTEVPEDAEQDCCALLWSLPLTIVFFTIVVVVVVTIGKGGHSLGMMECAPSFWLIFHLRRKSHCALIAAHDGIVMLRD